MDDILAHIYSQYKSYEFTISTRVLWYIFRDINFQYLLLMLFFMKNICIIFLFSYRYVNFYKVVIEWKTDWKFSTKMVKYVVLLYFIDIPSSCYCPTFRGNMFFLKNSYFLPGKTQLSWLRFFLWYGRYILVTWRT